MYVLKEAMTNFRKILKFRKFSQEIILCFIIITEFGSTKISTIRHAKIHSLEYAKIFADHLTLSYLRRLLMQFELHQRNSG